MSILTAPLKLVGKGAVKGATKLAGYSSKAAGKGVGKLAWGGVKKAGKFVGRHKLATAFGAMEAANKYNQTGDLGTALLSGGLAYGVGELGGHLITKGMSAGAGRLARKVKSPYARKVIRGLGTVGGVGASAGIYMSPAYMKFDRMTTGAVAGALDRGSTAMGAKDMFKRARIFANKQNQAHSQAVRLRDMAKAGKQRMLGKLGEMQGIQGVKNRRNLMDPKMFQSKYYQEQMEKARKLQEYRSFNRPELLNMQPL